MTTAGIFRSALLVLWQDIFDPETVHVVLGPRVGFTLDERLVIGNVEGDTEPEALGPQRTMQEQYRISCTVSVSANGTSDEQGDVNTRALELYAGAEHAVRSSPSQTLAVSGVMWAVVMGRWTIRDAPASETAGPLNTTIEFEVHVRAQYRL